MSHTIWWLPGPTHLLNLISNTFVEAGEIKPVLDTSPPGLEFNFGLTLFQLGPYLSLSLPNYGQIHRSSVIFLIKHTCFSFKRHRKGARAGKSEGEKRQTSIYAQENTLLILVSILRAARRLRFYQRWSSCCTKAISDHAYTDSVFFL